MRVTMTGVGERELIPLGLTVRLEMHLHSFPNSDSMDRLIQSHLRVSEFLVLGFRVIPVRRGHQYHDVFSAAGYIGDHVDGAWMFVMPVPGQAI